MGRSFIFGLIGAVLMLGLSATGSHAQDRQVSLREAVEMFAVHNLELQEVRSRAAELRALALQAAAYPNPSGIVSHEPLWRGDQSFSETYLNVSQRIEWPGLRSARIEAAERLADAAYADVQADSLRLLFDVARTYTETVASAQRQDVLESVTEIFRRADRANELMLAEGEVSGYRTRRLRVERARYENRLAMAELEATDARRRLALLVAPEDEAAQIYPEESFAEIPSDLPFEAALQLARAQRAELESARGEVEAAQAALTSTRMERLPEPTLTAGFKRQSDGFKGLFLGTAIPIPVFDRNQGAIEAQRQRLVAARSRLDLVEARIRLDVRRAYDLYAFLSGRMDLIGTELLGEADELLHAARVGYAEGEMSLVELLDAAEAYRDARMSSLDLLSDFQIAYFDLLRAAGGSIGRESFTTNANATNEP